MFEPSESELALAQEAMIAQQIAARGLVDPSLLAAFRAVPRHRFVPRALVRDACQDGPLAIGFGQTISQPYIVALMTWLLRPGPTHVVLEVGSGSGYQSAILAQLTRRVVALELLQPLADRAALTLASLGIDNVVTLCRDGRFGAPELAPPGGYDGILVAAVTPEPPDALLEQLAVGGRLVLPLGTISGHQELVTIEKGASGFERSTIIPVRFVPLVAPTKRPLE